MEDDKYFEHLTEMFTTKGWKIFLKEIEEGKQSIEDIRSIPSAEQFWLRKGSVEIYARILAYQSAIEQALEDSNG